jgi:hypothetical protein
MGEITSWKMFNTFLGEKFKKFSDHYRTFRFTTQFDPKGTFRSDFGNFDTVEDRVRIFFFDPPNTRIIETEIPKISENVLEFYFQDLKDENGKFLFKISMIHEKTIELIFQQRNSEVIYNSSIYFSRCLDRAYEKFKKLADSKENKIIAYRFSNSKMTKDNFFEERVEDFCSRHNFRYNSEPKDIVVPEWTLTDKNDQKYSLTISNIPAGPCIFFKKLAPSAVLREDGTDENDLLIHLAEDLQNGFNTFSNLFQPNIDEKVERLLDVEKWFQVKEQPQSWEENYVAIEEMRKQFKNMIVMIEKNNLLPVNPDRISLEDSPLEICEKLKRWFKKLLELHFGLRARQLGSRKKYSIFYEHRITNAIAEHIMDEPSVNEAFAHFQSLLQQCGAL